jgi:hypothetical protein
MGRLSVTARGVISASALYRAQGQARGLRHVPGPSTTERRQATPAYRPGISCDEFGRLVVGQECGVAQRLVDISGFEIGVVGEDVFPRLSRRQTSGTDT